MTMPQSSSKGSWGFVVFYVLVLAAFLFATISQSKHEKEGVRLSDETKQEIAAEVSKQVSEKIAVQKAAEDSAKKPVEYPDFESIAGPTMRKIEILKDFKTWTPDADIKKAAVSRKVLVDRGQLAKGYILVRASLNDRPLTLWESVYMKMGNRGGHLFRPQTLKTPPEDGVTTLLYSLQDIPFLPNVPYSDQRSPLHVDWFNLFKHGSRIDVLVYISALRPAVLNEISLYYECAEGSDCAVSLQ